MKTVTITEAKKQLGALLKRAAAGEAIGIICGADVVALRKVEVVAQEDTAEYSARVREEAPAYGQTERLRETGHDWFFSDDLNERGPAGENPIEMIGGPPREDWYFNFKPFEGGPVDGAINHDKYIYDDE